mgnify:CR=1 FL=1
MLIVHGLKPGCCIVEKFSQEIMFLECNPEAIFLNLFLMVYEHKIKLDFDGFVEPP